VRHALNEARLQNPVLTSRNGIGGKRMRISKHHIVTSEEYPTHTFVDAAVIGGREKSSYRGRSWNRFGFYEPRSQQMS